jgi:hypothetical protein
MCILPDTASLPTPDLCPAQALSPHQRQVLALQALAGTQPLRQLAEQHDVSRKFVYQQRDKAQQALDHAFDPGPDDQRVLFHLPVTKDWLRQLVLGLILLCHSSYRGVIELLRDLFDYPLSLGSVHNILQAAVPRARAVNEAQNLSGVRIGVPDEIFQSDVPVLVGCDADSTYCYLLSQEEQRDSDTWAVRLLELVDRGLCPEAIVADGGTALRAAHEAVLPDVPRRRDVFHAFHEELGPLVRAVEGRAYQAIDRRSRLESQRARPGQRRDRQKLSLAQQLRHARVEEARAIALSDDVTVLVGWLREDVLAVAGPEYAVRQELYDFVRAELQARPQWCPQRLGPVCTALQNQREGLLAFAAALDQDLQAVAQECEVPLGWVRETLAVQALSVHDVRRGPPEASLRRVLRSRYHRVSEAVAGVAGAVVRASSVGENLNSRLRNYFFLRRQVGPDSLSLLQFFLNHRRFLRSEHPRRVGRSPAELLTGQTHAHWLELLGYRCFVRP